MIDFLINLGVPKQFAGDVGLLIFFALFVVMLVFFFKKSNLGGLLVSIYIAFAITAKSYFEFLENFGIKVAYFIVIGFLVYTFFRKLFKLSIGGGRKLIVWMKTSILSVAITGLAASIILSWYPKEKFQEAFSSFSMGLFISDSAQLVWMVVPLVVVVVFKYRQ